MNKKILNLLVATGLCGFCPYSATAQTVNWEGDATPEQISVLPGQDIRNYTDWDPASASVPALPLPANIDSDDALIGEGSNPAATNIFRTRVFGFDLSEIPIPPCQDGSPATDVNVVINLQFTGDRSDGVGTDLFSRVFVNNDTVLDGVDLVGDAIDGQNTIKFKQLVSVDDLDSVRLLVAFQTLENGNKEFNWTMDVLSAGLAPNCPVTGDAELDFPIGAPNTAVASDPGGFDVTVHPSAPEGTISGWDASDVRFRYDPIDDLMYVAVNTLVPGGDADGDGDPATTSSWLAALNGIDLPDYAGTETIAVVLDVDQDGTGDVIIGTRFGQSINEYAVAAYNPAVPLSAAAFGFGAPLAGNTGEVLNSPETFDPNLPFNSSDLVMTISNWSELPTSTGANDDSARSFSYLMYQGSTVDNGIGEEWSPGIGEFGPIEIPEEPQALGSLGNLVWRDLDEDGNFDEGEETGIPGVVVLLIDSEGKEIGQQITDENGGYLFTDLPQGVYTVQIADSNFDDCGTPIYKSGKWALGGGLEFNGSNVTYQPSVVSVDGAFSIAAQVKPTLGEWQTIVEKGNDPWPYALWVNPEGEIHFGIDNGSGLEYVNSTGKLTGALEHVAVSFDGSAASFYINGALDSTVDFAVTVSDTAGDLYIGRNFEGCINDVRIYNSALDATTVNGLATMECGALVDFYQTTIVGGTADNTNKATPFTYGLAEGEDYLGADFGYNELGSIGNTVWCEEDGDGFFEPQDGEMGIAGVEVLLKNSDGEVIATETTDQDGQYLFDDLPAGTYSVEVPLTGSNVECPPVLASIDNVSTGLSYEIVDGLEQGDAFYVDRNYTVHTISDELGGFQFLRTANDDRNLVVDDHLTFTLSGDAEVCVAFYSYGHKPSWLANDGWTLSDEEFKITNGSCVWSYDIYCKSFSAGQVVLDGPGECAPMYGVFAKGTVCGALAGKEVTASQNSDPGDGASRTSPHVVELGAGQDYIRADFGFKVDVPVACIGNLVFYDCDGDGFFEPNSGDYGISGVKILLKDSSGSVVAVQYTDANGYYLFEDLSAGCFTLKVSNQNFHCGSPLYHYTQVVDRSNLEDDNVNRCQPLCVCLEEGDCYVKADFGYRNNCSYYYHCHYWRYNYSVQCWERRNQCYSNCWYFAD